jgi:hypothetical protein
MHISGKAPPEASRILTPGDELLRKWPMKYARLRCSFTLRLGACSVERCGQYAADIHIVAAYVDLAVS